MANSSGLFQQPKNRLFPIPNPFIIHKKSIGHNIQKKKEYKLLEEIHKDFIFLKLVSLEKILLTIKSKIAIDGDIDEQITSEDIQNSLNQLERKKKKSIFKVNTTSLNEFKEENYFKHKNLISQALGNMFKNMFELKEQTFNQSLENQEFTLISLDQLIINNFLISFEGNDFENFCFDEITKNSIDNIIKMIEKGKFYFEKNQNKNAFTEKFVSIIKIIGHNLEVSVPFNFKSLM